MKNIKKYLLLLALVITSILILPVNMFAQSPPDCSIIGSTIACEENDVNYTYSLSCLGYSCGTIAWDIPSGGAVVSQSGGTVTIKWLTAGQHSLTATSNCFGINHDDPDDEFPDLHGPSVVNGIDIPVSQTISVLVTTAPPIPIVQVDYTCGDDQAVLSVVDDSNINTIYKWYEGDQFLVEGLSYTTPVFTGMKIYTCRVYNIIGGSCYSYLPVEVTIVNDLELEVGIINPVATYRKTRIFATQINSFANISLKYYWQTSTSGTETNFEVSVLGVLNNNSTSVHREYTYITEPDTYYMRGYNEASQCWIDASEPLDVEVLTIPPPPTIFQGKRLGSTHVVLTNTDLEHFKTYADVYWVSGLGQTSSDLFVDREEIFEKGTYYLRAKDKITGDWGDITLEFYLDVREDNMLNWVSTKIFDGSPDNIVVSESKAYFDTAGKPLQSQTRNITEQQVLATQVIRDTYDREVLSTLPAPINTPVFRYREGFVRNPSDTDYDYKDFDQGNFKYSPKPVQNNKTGTLGYYYSTNNTLEDNVPTTSYPYTRTEYYEDGTGEVKTVAGPGDLHRLGAGHNTISKTLPITEATATALTDYIDLRQLIISGSNEVDMMSNGIKSVGTDANGIMGMSITDKNGNTILSGVQAEQGATSSIDFGEGHIIDHVSYNFYDDAGRLVASIAPMGVKELIDNGLAGYTKDNLPFTTYYKYNHQGWLLSMTEPDAGRTEYMYRRDGSIRFSQNTKQAENVNATHQEYSYTSYDELGRPVESGEYVSFWDNINPIEFKGIEMINSLEDTELSYLSEGINSQPKYNTESNDWVRTYYDLSAPNFDTETSLGATYVQDFVMGAVSWTENENIKTWYSYDEMGRVTWMAQKPVDLPLSFVVSYEYDFLGNVEKVNYQSYLNGIITDQFYHYYYYDADKRLSETFTSEFNYTDETTVRANATLQAKYYYYLHGPLKRIELGGNLQGVDFVYNIQGWLTSINDPNSTTDQAGFSDDAFSMVLEYYESSMTNLTNPLGAIPPTPLHQHGLSSENYMPQFAGLFMQFSPAINASTFSADGTQQGVQLSSYSAERSQYRKLMENYALSLNNKTTNK